VIKRGGPHRIEDLQIDFRHHLDRGLPFVAARPPADDGGQRRTRASPGRAH
jgi:hypothetical protein